MSARAKLLVGWVLALSVGLLFAALGLWQLARMHQKQTMLDAVHEVLRQRRANPLALAANMQRQHDYDWAAGVGRFASAPAVLLDNQQRHGRVGARAYALFYADGAMPLLVELGWLPLPGDRRLPQVVIPPGQQRIAGLLLPPPSHGLAVAVIDPAANDPLLVTGLDAPQLPQRLGASHLAPRILRLDPALPLGYARDLDVLPNTLPPQRHLGYAVQWFALALTVLATALLLTYRAFSKPRPTL